MKTRIFALTLAVVLVFGLLPPAAAAAQNGTWGDNLAWTFDNGLLTISGEGEMADADFLWDEDGNPLGTDAPWYSLGVTDVVISPGVSSVGHAAFAGITTLKTVSLPDTLTVIGPWAFESCTGLETINLPPYLTDIRYDAFSGCASLHGPLAIPGQVTVIEDDVFAYCESLTEVALHDGITSIGFAAFLGSGLTQIEIPAAVEWVDAQAFGQCANLTSITVAAGNEFYDSDSQGALYTEGMLELEQVPGGYTGTFVVPSTVTMLWNYAAFEGCTKLETVHIPASVTEMLSYLFSSCTSLKAIEVDGANPVYYDVDGILYGNVTAYDADANEISCLALMTCPPAKDVGAFTVGSEVQMLDAYSFYGCGGLTEITIPATCTYVYTGIFESCGNLQAIWFGEGHPSYCSDDEGVVFNQEMVVEEYDPVTGKFLTITYPAGSTLCFFPTGRTGYYEIPEGVTEVMGGSFSGSRIQAVTFPTGFETLSYWSMDNCENLSWLRFAGDKPNALDGCLEDVTATVYYPEINETWDDPTLEFSYGDLTYVPYSPTDVPTWPGQDGPRNPFTDVKDTSYCYKPILWAVENSITKGMSDTTFVPDGACTRGQVVTFLWRACGSPEPTITDHPFTDVNENAFYYRAMLWAVETGITTGMTPTTFEPDRVCDRGTVVTFLHRAQGKPAPTAADHPFTDVEEDRFYYRAMLWAVENKITSGMTPTTFAPKTACTRGQVVTFLYRAYAK